MPTNDGRHVLTEPVLTEHGLTESDTDDSKYSRIRQYLLEVVRGLPEGAKIPSERSLSTQFGVARATIRQALVDIEHRGMLKRVTGAGTFVTRTTVVQRLAVISSFTEDMRNRGMRSSTILLESVRGPVAPVVMERLKLAGDADVLFVKRLRLADDEPMALDRLYVPSWVVPTLSEEDLGQVPFYALLRESGVVVVSGEEAISSTSLKRDEAEALGVRMRSPALLVERTSWDKEGRPIEFSQTTYRGDRYTIRAALGPDAYR